jgi:hypothetical protein
MERVGAQSGQAPYRAEVVTAALQWRATFRRVARGFVIVAGVTALGATLVIGLHVAVARRDEDRSRLWSPVEATAEPAREKLIAEDVKAIVQGMEASGRL